MNACGLLSSLQISRAAPSPNLTSWGSRQWFWTSFPETSVFHDRMFPPQPAPSGEPGPPGLVHPCPSGTEPMGGNQDPPAWLSSPRAVLQPSPWQEGPRSGSSFSGPPSTRGRKENLCPGLQQILEEALSHILPSEGGKQDPAVRSHR